MKILLTILASIVVIELLALLWLYLSVSSYQKFWQNKAKEPGEITYVALGDSAAQGIGATSPMRGYVGLIAKKLEAKTGKKVRVINLSVTGAKLEDYLKTQAPVIGKYKPDVVTVEIGANDVGRYLEADFKERFQKVLEALPSGAYVSNMPLFDSRPGSTKAAKQASAVIEELIKKDGRITFVDLQKYTTENQSIFGFAPDLFHPNNLSYKNWANAFWQQIEKDL